jgi:outer membrane lipoprotein
LKQFWVLIIAGTLLWGLNGCTAALSQEARDQVTLEGAFGDIVIDPRRYVGEVVALGGRIIATTPHDGHTELMVLQLPLEVGLRPRSDGSSEGRFLVQTEEFLDPAVYAPDRMITLVGKIQGLQERPLGQTRYNYPELSLIEMKLWPKEEVHREPRFQFGFGVGTHF